MPDGDLHVLWNCELATILDHLLCGLDFSSVAGLSIFFRIFVEFSERNIQQNWGIDGRSFLMAPSANLRWHMMLLVKWWDTMKSTWSSPNKITFSNPPPLPQASANAYWTTIGVSRTALENRWCLVWCVDWLNPPFGESTGMMIADSYWSWLISTRIDYHWLSLMFIDVLFIVFTIVDVYPLLLIAHYYPNTVITTVSLSYSSEMGGYRVERPLKMQIASPFHLCFLLTLFKREPRKKECIWMYLWFFFNIAMV